MLILSPHVSDYPLHSSPALMKAFGLLTIFLITFKIAFNIILYSGEVFRIVQYIYTVIGFYGTHTM